MRFERVIAIIVLINIVYAIINVFQLGSFIPLMPFHEFFLACIFIVVSLVAFWNKSSLILYSSTVFAIVLIAKSEFLLGLFLNNQSLYLYNHTASPVLDVLYVLIFVSLFFITSFKIASNNSLIRGVGVFIGVGFAVINILGASNLILLIYLMIIGLFLVIILQKAITIKEPVKCLTIGMLGFVAQNVVNDLPTILN